MIPVDSLLYKIDQRLNKLSTNDHQQINLEDKILALNEAQIKLIKQKVDGFSVASGMGLDSFKKRYEDLQRLVIQYNHQPLNLVEINKELNQYELGQVIDVEEPSYDFDNDGDYEEEEDTMMPGKAEPEVTQQQAEIDYSELTQRELTELIDDALDKGDFKRVEMLAQYMKEGKEIYLKELERINEGSRFHTRRK